MRLGTALKAALLSAAFAVSSAPASEPAAGATGAATGKLAGGGTYVVQPAQGAPAAAIALWYRAPASGFDTDGTPGIGRLAGAAVAASKPITGTSLGAFIARVGGRITVVSYPDSVAISMIVPSDRASDAVHALTQAYFAPVLDDAGLTVAKHELAESSALRQFTPDLAIGDALSAALFPAGPSHFPGLATPETFDKLTVDRVRAYAERAFRPANAVLVVTGNVDSSVLTSAVPGRSDAAPGVEPPLVAVPVASATAVAKVGSDAGFGLAFAGPAIADDREATALDFIADYLFYGNTGTVQRALRTAKATVTGTFVTYHDPGVMLVTGTGDDLATARTTVQNALATVQKPLDRATFAAAQRAFLYHIMSDLQTPSQYADTVGWYTVEGAPGYAPGNAAGTYFTLAGALTPEFVAATAAKYLSHPLVTAEFTAKKAPAK